MAIYPLEATVTVGSIFKRRPAPPQGLGLQDTSSNAPWLLAAIKIGIVGLIALFAPRSDRWPEITGLALIAGGAAGNIIDRIRIGAVVDYIDLFYAGWHWPTFNLADMWIFLGVVLLIGGPLLAPRRRTIGP